MVEKNAAVYRTLQDNQKKLGCVQVLLCHQDGLEFVSRDTQRYDVIFLDPPFQSDYYVGLLRILPQRLNENGVVYVESGAVIEVTMPWKAIKSGRAGRVHYSLLQLG